MNTIEPGMKEVSKDQFFKAIGPHDIIGHIMNDHPPYITNFTKRHSREVVGKIVEYYPEGKRPAKERYYLKEGAL